jgi:hypothetical protein
MISSLKVGKRGGVSGCDFMLLAPITYGIIRLAVSIWARSGFDEPSFGFWVTTLPMSVMLLAIYPYSTLQLFCAHVANVFSGKRSQSATHQFNFAQAICFGPLLQRRGDSEHTEQQVAPIAALATRNDEGQGHAPRAYVGDGAQPAADGSRLKSGGGALLSRLLLLHGRPQIRSYIPLTF